MNVGQELIIFLTFISTFSIVICFMKLSSEANIEYEGMLNREVFFYYDIACLKTNFDLNKTGISPLKFRNKKLPKRVIQRFLVGYTKCRSPHDGNFVSRQ